MRGRTHVVNACTRDMTDVPAGSVDARTLSMPATYRAPTVGAAHSSVMRLYTVRPPAVATGTNASRGWHDSRGLRVFQA